MLVLRFFQNEEIRRFPEEKLQRKFANMKKDVIKKSFPF